MTTGACNDFGGDSLHQHNNPQEEVHLREALKRCSARTLNAALQFRLTRDPAQLSVIILGVIHTYVDGILQGRLTDPVKKIRLIEDLAIDSLTLMEIMILLEDVLQVSIPDGHLRQVRTVGDIQDFVERRLGNASSPAGVKQPLPDWGITESGRSA